MSQRKLFCRGEIVKYIIVNSTYSVSNVKRKKHTTVSYPNFFLKKRIYNRFFSLVSVSVFVHQKLSNLKVLFA